MFIYFLGVSSILFDSLSFLNNRLETAVSDALHVEEHVFVLLVGVFFIEVRRYFFVDCVAVGAGFINYEREENCFVWFCSRYFREFHCCPFRV